jgi:OmpA-OmpF porin, OOP family
VRALLAALLLSAPACAAAPHAAPGSAEAGDLCPNEPEDRDGFQDGDGCPDPDNDRDGIVDDDDPCPDRPGDCSAQDAR